MTDGPRLPDPQQPDRDAEAADALKDVKGILDNAGLTQSIESMIHEYAPYLGLLTYLYPSIIKLGISPAGAEQMCLTVWYKLFAPEWDGEDGDGI